MFRFKQAFGACLLLTTLVPIVAAHAATYYVATTGSNSNPGTEKQPWQTVAYAVATMVAGDTTYVRGGTFKEAMVRFKRSGTQAAPIKLLNYPGESPVIDFEDKAVERRLLLEHGSGQANAMAWITIEGFEIKNSWDGIKWYNAQDVTIRRNRLHDNRHQGILGQGGLRVIIDRNAIYHNGDFVRCEVEAWYCAQDHGIYAYGSQYTIANNLIYDNMGNGIQHNGSSTSIFDPLKHPSQEFAGAANWLIAHNTFAYQANAAGIVEWGAQCHNTRIENNIFYENRVNNTTSAQGVIFTSLACSGIQIRNNLAYATAPGGTSFIGSGATEGVHYMQSGNIVNVSNPGFVNAPAILPTSPNFALTARSPAIDTGLSIVTTRTAFDGTIRPQGRAPDLGAYEYTASGDAQSPTAPVALRVN